MHLSTFPQRVCAIASLLGLLVRPGLALDDYEPGPDSKPQSSVPRGALTKHSFTNSTVYPGTVRDYWLYVPQQYDPAKAACVMVFQDGQSYVSTNGQFR